MILFCTKDILGGFDNKDMNGKGKPSKARAFLVTRTKNDKKYKKPMNNILPTFRKIYFLIFSQDFAFLSLNFY